MRLRRKLIKVLLNLVYLNLVHLHELEKNSNLTQNKIVLNIADNLQYNE